MTIRAIARGVGWDFVDSTALSRAGNPDRARVEADVAAYFAAGGVVHQAASVQLHAESRPSMRGGVKSRRYWVTTPGALSFTGADGQRKPPKAEALIKYGRQRPCGCVEQCSQAEVVHG